MNQDGNDGLGDDDSPAPMGHQACEDHKHMVLYQISTWFVYQLLLCVDGLSDAKHDRWRTHAEGSQEHATRRCAMYK